MNVKPFILLTLVTACLFVNGCAVFYKRTTVHALNIPASDCLRTEREYGVLELGGENSPIRVPLVLTREIEPKPIPFKP